MTFDKIPSGLLEVIKAYDKDTNLCFMAWGQAKRLLNSHNYCDIKEVRDLTLFGEFKSVKLKEVAAITLVDGKRVGTVRKGHKFKADGFFFTPNHLLGVNDETETEENLEGCQPAGPQPAHPN